MSWVDWVSLPYVAVFAVWMLLTVRRSERYRLRLGCDLLILAGTGVNVLFGTDRGAAFRLIDLAWWTCLTAYWIPVHALRAGVFCLRPGHDRMTMVATIDGHSRMMLSVPPEHPMFEAAMARVGVQFDPSETVTSVVCNRCHRDLDA